MVILTAENHIKIDGTPFFLVEEQTQHRQHASAGRAVGTDQCELI
jgi:hypothetical protein